MASLCAAPAGARRRSPTPNIVADNTLTETGVAGWAGDNVKGGGAPSGRALGVTGTAARALVRGNTISGFSTASMWGFFDSAADAAVARLTGAGGQHHLAGQRRWRRARGRLRWRFRLSTVWWRTCGPACRCRPSPRGPVCLVRTIMDGYAVSAVKVNNGPTGRVYLSLPHHRPPRGGLPRAAAAARQPTPPRGRCGRPAPLAASLPPTTSSSLEGSCNFEMS